MGFLLISQLSNQQRSKKPLALQIVARAYPALDSTTLAFLEIFKRFAVSIGVVRVGHVHLT